ncbi:unnamed protein product [Phytomonas sp. Hart1]|nr:unnamed protein product [Phytomonas sp. Hart1]|eukprot:CCW69984.1 unnamed protein product [Phytomonas sp. isolate Hart1]
MLTDAFPDEDRAIVGAFFPSSDVCEKAWRGVQLLAEADDLTFWTVIAHHETLSGVLTNLVKAVEVAHSSASPVRRRAIRPANEHALGVIFMRIGATTAVCTRRRVSVQDLARRLNKILPLPLIFPISAMLLRRNGSAASVCVSSLFLLNPGYLCRLPLFINSWCDSINQITMRCKSELQRGRFQRISGDILPLFEQTFRHVRQLWAAVHCSPFLADYINITRVLRALRIVVDVISPLLQHFVLLCKDLNPIRDILSQANSILINSALNTSVILVLFHHFGDLAGHLAWVLPKPVEKAYTALQEAIEHYAPGIPAQLVRSCRVFKNLSSLFHALVPTKMDNPDLRFGEVMLLVLSEDIQGSKDFAELLSREHARHRYGELLLLELTHQGVCFGELLQKQFLTIDESEKLGARKDVIAAILSRPPPESEPERAGFSLNSPSKPSEPNEVWESENVSPPDCADSAVAMVREIFPHYSPAGIRTALDFYGDVEQFILDASINNIPPHLIDLLKAPPPPPKGAVGAPMGDRELPELTVAQTTLTKEDFDEALSRTDFHHYLGGDLYKFLLGGGENQNCGEDEANNVNWDAVYSGVTSYRKEDGNLQAENIAFNIDEDLKDKIRMLNEYIYEDELDDTELDVVMNNSVDDSSDSQDEVDRYHGKLIGDAGLVVNSPTEGHHAGSLSSSSRRIPNDDYHQKRFQVKKAKERANFVKKRIADAADSTSEGTRKVPSYANKKKTERRPLRRKGGDQNDVLKAVQKGRLHADF